MNPSGSAFREGQDAGPVRPLSVQRDAFESLTLNGLNRFYRATGEQAAHALFLSEVAAQLAWCDSPEGWAEQRETKIPNLEAFGYAYLYTGDAAYLRAGRHILQYALNNGMLRFYNTMQPVGDMRHARPAHYRLGRVQPINGQILGLAIGPLLCFMEIAEGAGVLEEWIGHRASDMYATSSYSDA